MTNYERITKALPAQLAEILAKNPMQAAYSAYYTSEITDLAPTPEKIILWWLNQTATEGDKA